MAEGDQKTSNFLQETVRELISQSDWMRDILSDKETRQAIETDLGLEPGAVKELPPELASITNYRKAASDGGNLDKQVSLEVLTDIITLWDSYAAMAEAAVASGGLKEGDKEAARELAHSLLSLMLTGWFRLRYPKLHRLG